MSQIERLKFIDDQINKNGKVRKNEVLKIFEIDERTFKRDIEYLRVRLNAPVVYFRENDCYIYTADFSLFKFYEEKSLLLISLIKKIIENCDFVPIASDSILRELKKHENKDYKNLYENIIYDLPAHQSPNSESFRICLESIIQKKQCVMEYTNIAGECKARTVEPLKIINYSGLWYMLCYCHKSSALRTFALSRVGNIFLSDKAFNYHPDSDKINNFISSSFGIMKMQPDLQNITKVKIRFRGKGYYLVKDLQFHSTQKTEAGKDESGEFIDLSFPVADYREILGRVLQYGTDAEVVAPDDFRELWRETIREMYHKFV